MRILIPDAQSFHGGVETVTTRVIEAWTKSSKNQVTWVLPPHRIQAFRNQFLDNHNVKIEKFQWNRLHPRSLILSALRVANPRFARKWESKSNQQRLHKIATRNGCTKCFYFWPVREPFPDLHIPVFSLICDLAWQQVPESYPLDDPVELDREISQWVERSHKVFTISNSTRSEVIKLTPEFSEKIHAVPLAAERSTSRPEISSRIRPFVSDQVPFFLYPSAASSHKNHILLFQAAFELIERDIDFRIVLTGPQTQFLLGEKTIDRPGAEETRLFYQKHKKALSNRIFALSNIPIKELQHLYRECLAVVFPSKYEGFGLAIAEAFAHGKPVIVSDIPVFTEQIKFYQANDFVNTFPVTNMKILADLMEKRLNEGALSDKRSQILIDRSTHWTWMDVANSYLKLMHEH